MAIYLQQYLIFYVILFFIHLFYSSVCEEIIWTSRNPRYLAFPPGAGNKLQVISGFGIPVELKEESVTFGLILKTNYELPTNSVQFTHPELAFPDVELKMTRWSLYSLLENALEKLSFGGRDCILRSICQSAFTSFENSGLFGEILEILFLPSRTNDILGNNDYIDAETIGHRLSEEEHCLARYPDCPTSLLDIITIVENNNYAEEILTKITNYL